MVSQIRPTKQLDEPHKTRENAFTGMFMADHLHVGGLSRDDMHIISFSQNVVPGPLWGGLRHQPCWSRDDIVSGLAVKRMLK